MENLPGQGFGVTCCACVSFAWEIVRDSPMVNFDSQTMNKHIKMRLGHRRRSLCCLETQNAPWRHWRIPSIYSQKERFIYLFMKLQISQLAKTTRGLQTARALRARQDYKVTPHRAWLRTIRTFLMFKRKGNFRQEPIMGSCFRAIFGLMRVLSTKIPFGIVSRFTLINLNQAN